MHVMHPDLDLRKARPAIASARQRRCTHDNAARSLLSRANLIAQVHCMAHCSCSECADTYYLHCLAPADAGGLYVSDR